MKRSIFLISLLSAFSFLKCWAAEKISLNKKEWGLVYFIGMSSSETINKLAANSTNVQLNKLSGDYEKLMKDLHKAMLVTIAGHASKADGKEFNQLKLDIQRKYKIINTETGEYLSEI